MLKPQGSGTSEREQAKHGQGVRFGVAGVLLGLLVLLVVATPLGEQLWDLLRNPSVERVRRLLDSTTMWLPLLIVGLMILHTLIPVPAEILALAAGMALGPFWGFLTIWLGAMLGAYMGFFLTRTFGQPLLQRLVSPQRLQHAQRWLQRVDIPLLLAARLMPVISFNLINYVLGLTAISWWRFTWTTGIGIIPLTVCMVLFGVHLNDWRFLTVMTLATVVVCLTGYLFLRRRYTRSPL